MCAKEAVATSADLMSEQTSRSLLHLCAVALRLYNRESNTACLFQTVFQCLRVHRIRAIPDTFPVCGLPDLTPVFQVLARSNESRALCSISGFPWSGIWYRPRRVPGNAHRLCGSFLRTPGRSCFRYTLPSPSSLNYSVISFIILCHWSRILLYSSVPQLYPCFLTYLSTA